MDLFNCSDYVCSSVCLKCAEYSNFWDNTSHENFGSGTGRSQRTEVTGADKSTEVEKDIATAIIADGYHDGADGDRADHEGKVEGKHCTDCADNVFDLNYEKVASIKEVMNRRNGSTINTEQIVRMKS